MKRKIKVTKASNPNFWYAACIGGVFEGVVKDKYTNNWVTDRGRWISMSDAIMLDN